MGGDKPIPWRGCEVAPDKTAKLRPRGSKQKSKILFFLNFLKGPKIETKRPRFAPGAFSKKGKFTSIVTQLFIVADCGFGSCPKNLLLLCQAKTHHHRYSTTVPKLWKWSSPLGKVRRSDLIWLIFRERRWQDKSRQLTEKHWSRRPWLKYVLTLGYLHIWQGGIKLCKPANQVQGQLRPLEQAWPCDYTMCHTMD